MTGDDRSHRGEPVASNSSGWRLHDVHQGRLYATAGRALFVEGEPGSGTFERTGRLPAPAVSVRQLRRFRRWLLAGRLRPAVERLVGRVTVSNVWPVSAEDLVATVGDRVYSSHDGGSAWDERHRLPESSGPMGVLPTAFCRDGRRILLGEYPLSSEETARILESHDSGRTWETVTRLPEVRHVHAVQRDPVSGDVWVTTGDTDSQSRIGRLRDGEFVPVGGGSQRWRAVELAFTAEALVWGVDCVYATEKEVLVLSRDALDDPDPQPRSVYATEGPVYYAESVSAGQEWVLLSTSGSSGTDSTAPGEPNRSSGVAQVVAASAGSDFQEWVEVGRYRRRRSPTDWLPFGDRLPTADAYVFLGADPDRGFFLNPYNVHRADRSISRIPTGALDRRSPDATRSRLGQ